MAKGENQHRSPGGGLRPRPAEKRDERISLAVIQGTLQARAELVGKLREQAATLGVKVYWLEDVGLGELVGKVGRRGTAEPVGARQEYKEYSGPSLSRRELEILGLVANGATNREIAAVLGLAPNTIKTYWQRALRKLGARNRAQAIVRAHERQLLPDTAETAEAADTPEATVRAV